LIGRHDEWRTLIQARGLGLQYGSKRVLDGLDFEIPAGRVVGLLGHNGAGKTSLMRALVGLTGHEGELSVLGLSPQRQRTALLQSLCYIPDVAILPRWARASRLITLMAGLHPRFSAERARQLLKRTSVGLNDKVKTLSRGMVVQLHLALVAAIDARLMVLDEPTLGWTCSRARPSTRC
jgi:ABC-2 type transport system ATP-binding protein